MSNKIDISNCHSVLRYCQNVRSIPRVENPSIFLYKDSEILTFDCAVEQNDVTYVTSNTSESYDLFLNSCLYITQSLCNLGGTIQQRLNGRIAFLLFGEREYNYHNVLDCIASTLQFNIASALIENGQCILFVQYGKLSIDDVLKLTEMGNKIIICGYEYSENHYRIRKI